MYNVFISYFQLAVFAIVAGNCRDLLAAGWLPMEEFTLDTDN